MKLAVFCEKCLFSWNPCNSLKVMIFGYFQCILLPSVLWRCWLGGRKGIRPVKNRVVGCWRSICLEQGADLHMAQLMPLPLNVSCCSKIQIGFTFLVPAQLGSTGKRAVKRVCVCVCLLPSVPLPSVLRCCWLGGRKGIRPVKNWVVGCWHGYLSRARCRLACGPADATATHCLFSKTQIGFTFLVPAHPGSPGQRAVKRVCVCVFVAFWLLFYSSRGAFLPPFRSHLKTNPTSILILAHWWSALCVLIIMTDDWY